MTVLNIAFKAERKGHQMLIEEVLDKDSQVVALRFSCHPCGVETNYFPEQHPKYRLALRAAEDEGRKHAGVDNLSWALVT
jgi:hypothetical protein